MLIWVMVGSVVAYPIVMRFLAKWVQPKRLEMARLATLLLVDARTGETQKQVIRMMVADAFDPRLAIVLVAVFPAFAFAKLLGRASSPPDDVDVTMAESMERFRILHTLSLAAANPIFFAVLFLEAMIFGAIATPVALLTGNSEKTNPMKMRNLAIVKSESYMRHVQMAHPA